MKIAGISSPERQKTRSLARPFVEKAVERKPKTFGIIHEEIPELSKLWDEDFQSFKHQRREALGHTPIYNSVSIYDNNPLYSEYSCSDEKPDPAWVGATEREKRAMALGKTAAQDILMDSLRYRKGWTQPTSKGQKILESNILELRLRFGTE